MKKIKNIIIRFYRKYTGKKFSKEEIILIALVVVAAVLLVLAKGCYFVGFFGDDAYQIIGAESILRGKLREINNPFQPPFVDYFPGWPFLLTPVVYLFYDHFALYQYYSILFSIGSIIIAIMLFKNIINIYGLVSLILISFYNPLFVSLAGTLNQEPSFTFFSLLTILLLFKYMKSQKKLKNPMQEIIHNQFFLPMVVSLTLLLYIRPTGIVLLCAAVLFFFMRRQYKLGLYFGFFPVILLAPLLIRNILLVKTPTTYLSQFFSSYDSLLKKGTFFASHFAAQIIYYTKQILVQTFFRLPDKTPALIMILLAATLAVLLCTGLILPVKNKRENLLKYYLIGFIILHLLWPLQASRYFFPVLVFIAFYILIGTQYFLEKLKIKKVWLLIPGLLSLILSMPVDIYIIKASFLKNNPMSRPPRATINWVKTHTRNDDVIASGNAGKYYIYTKRKTIEVLPRLNRLKKIEKRLHYYILESDEMVLNKESIYGTDEFNAIKQRYEILFHSPKDKTYILDISKIRTGAEEIK